MECPSDSFCTIMARGVEKWQEPNEFPWSSRTLFPTIWHFLYMNFQSSTADLVVKE